jgi:hypothetical protein
MLYGFGDDLQPLHETLDLVEDIVLDYSTTILHRVGAPCKCSRVLRPAAGC